MFQTFLHRAATVGQAAARLEKPWPNHRLDPGEGAPLRSVQERAMGLFPASDGSELAFDERGSGAPTLLFIHGWQANRTLWREVIAAVGTRRHALAVDLRGFGDSREARGPYHLERFAADLRELVERLDLAPVVLVGHSMGATVALRLAVDAPQLVAGLVLIAPVPAGGGEYTEKGKSFLRSTAGNPAAAKTWLARTVNAPPDGATLQRLGEAAAAALPEAVLESFESWAHADFAAATRSVTAPALVIAPENDRPDVAERKVSQLLPNARHVVLPNAAHYATVEQAREVAALIAEFVASFDSAQDDTE